MILNIFGRKVYVRKEIIAIIIPFIVITFGLVGFYLSKDKSAVIIETGIKAIDKSAEDKFASSESQKSDSMTKQSENGEVKNTADIGNDKRSADDEIKVYVVGCINNPGIVTLIKGQIIDDAIKLAGGFTNEAASDDINLVYKLRENVMINIRSKEEITKQESNMQQYQVTEAGKGIEVIADSKGAISEDETGAETKKKININFASEKELDTLPGIGPETAKDIIAYRTKAGEFKKIEDIMKVTGIKDSKFSKVKDYIIVN